MKLKTQMTSLIALFAMLLVLGTSTVWANDYSIYGNEIGTLLQGNSSLPQAATIAKLENYSVYGNGIDTILTDTGRLVSSTFIAGLSGMSIYSDTMDVYMGAGFAGPSFDLNLFDRLVYAK